MTKRGDLLDDKVIRRQWTKVYFDVQRIRQQVTQGSFNFLVRTKRSDTISRCSK